MSQGQQLMFKSENSGEHRRIDYLNLNKLFLIRYFDHVEFRKVECSRIELMLREVVGWIVEETDDYIKIVSEKVASEDPDLIAKLKPVGLVILKSAIKEVKEID